MANEEEKKISLDEKYPRINFRLGVNSPLTKDITVRTGTGSGHTADYIAKRDLERYYYGLRMALAKLNPPLKLNEWSFLIDVCNGTIFEPFSIPMLWAEASDAMVEGYGKKHEIENPEGFVQRLRSMSWIELAAIADGIERFWNSETNHIESTNERIYEVGLVRREEK